ncbi:hypothetical protein J7J81_01190 [bacterium]|nr:hypothetical protein [bacterium]
MEKVRKGLKEAIDLYRSLPAATFFKGLTGYGFRLENEVEDIGELESDCQIIHPMYFFIVGGERKGRKTLKAENVKSAVEFFKAHALAAVLRVTTGKGVRVVNGMAEIKDILEATTDVIFELTHYGGRSLCPTLKVKLGKVIDPTVKWQSGFEYRTHKGQELELTRHLAETEFTSEENWKQAWADVEKEVRRLTLLHCEDQLKSGHINGGDRIRAFLAQELTSVLPEAEIDRQYGYDYEIRHGVVIVRKSLRPFEYQDEATFQTAMDAFSKECMRVYTLHCQSVDKEGRFGQPSSEEAELMEIDEVSFECDERRSTEKEERLIAWHERKPVFPQDGWKPEKGKTYRVFLAKRGRGLRAIPAGPKYREQITETEDTDTVEISTVRIEYDGTEKSLGSREVKLETREVPEERQEYKVVLSEAGVKVQIIKKKFLCEEKQKVKYNKDGLEWSRTGKEKLVSKEIVAEENPLEWNCYRYDGSEFYNHRLDPVWDPGWVIRISALLKSGWNEKWVETETTLEKLPKVVRTQIEEWFPLCKCGRQRYESKGKDKRCNLCRQEEKCEGCGKAGTYPTVSPISGRKLCYKCLSQEKREKAISLLTPEELKQIRNEAKELLSGKWQSRNSWRMGKDILPEIASLPEEARWKIEDRPDWEWFYVTKDGFLYGSKLAPQKLEKISQMKTQKEVATGIGLILYPFSADEYQLLEEEKIRELKVQVGEETVLVELIRQPERLKMEAEKKLSNLQKFLEEVEDNTFLKYKEKENIQNFIRKSEAALRKENFKKALELVNEGSEKTKGLQKLLEKRAECTRKVEQAIAKHYSHCPLCGKEMDDGECRASHELERIEFPEYDEEGYPIEAAVLSQIVTDTGKVVAELRCSCGSRRREVGEIYLLTDYDLDDSRWTEGEIFDSLEFKDFKRILNPEAVKLKRTERELEQAQREYEEDIKIAQQQGYIRLRFSKGKHPKTGEDQWEAITKDGKLTVKYIVDRWGSQPVEGKMYYCSLGRELISGSRFKLVIVHLEPPFPEEAERIRGLEQKLEEAKKKADSSDPVTEPSEKEGEVTEEILQALKNKLEGGDD